MKKVEVLYFAGCPNCEPTVQRIRGVASELQIEADITFVEITTPDEAVRRRFLGSPTVLVDGIDVEPEARMRSDFGMACRWYAGDGMPSREMIAASLQSATRPACCAGIRHEGRTLRIKGWTPVWLLSVLALAIMLFPYYVGQVSGGIVPPNPPGNGEMLRVAISGMTCEGCAMAAKKKLEAVPSVQSVRVSLSKQEAIVVALEDETFVRQRILTALGNVGFTGSFPEESNDSLAR